MVVSAIKVIRYLFIYFFLYTYVYFVFKNCQLSKTATSISLTFTQLIVPSYRILDHFITYEMTYQN